MVIRSCVGAAVVIVALAACAAKPVAQGPRPDAGDVSLRPVVSWQGHQLREVASLTALPASIRQALGADKSGLDGVADRGQPFNATDNIVEIAPMKRFITAGHDGDLWLVVIEQGGFGYSVLVLEFAGGDVQNQWVLSDRLKTLKDAVRAISVQRS